MQNNRRFHRSPQREAIYDYVAARKSHLSAEEIYAALRLRHPRLSMGTVYRNLHILVAQGRLVALRFGSGQDLYDARLDLHAHLLCRGCGDLLDADIPAMPDLDQWAGKRILDFQVDGYSLVFSGLCKSCRKRQAAAPS
jgi:Fur family transcriptional regulator, peroxide stress response regulator